MRFSVNDMQWNLAAGPGDAVASESFSTLDRVFDLDGPRVSHGGLCHVIKLHLGGRDYYVKRYQNRGKHLLKAFGRNRAATEHHNLAFFARLGIPVPRVVAYGGVRRFGLLRRAAIITEGVPNATDLRTVAHTRPDLLASRRWVFAAMRQVADYTRRIHSDGFTHRDLKWRNILAETREAPRIFFFDCPSGRHVSALRRRHFILRDLAGLDRLAREHLSRTMRLRFYLWYRNRTHLTKEDRKLIARVVTYHNRR